MNIKGRDVVVEGEGAGREEMVAVSRAVVAATISFLSGVRLLALHHLSFRHHPLPYTWPLLCTGEGRKATEPPSPRKEGGREGGRKGGTGEGGAVITWDRVTCSYKNLT